MTDSRHVKGLRRKVLLACGLAALACVACGSDAVVAPPLQREALPSEAPHAPEATPAVDGDAAEASRDVEPAAAPEPGEATDSAPPVPTPPLYPQPRAAAEPPSAAFAVLSTESDGVVQGLRTTCPAVLVAADVAVVAAHCFDWHRDPKRGGYPVSGRHTLTLSNGWRAEATQVSVHPDYRLVSCDDRMGKRYRVLCAAAQSACLARHALSPTQLAVCMSDAAVQVDAWLGGPQHDLAAVYLQTATSGVTPLAMASPGDALPTGELAVLNLAQGQVGDMTDHWYSAPASQPVWQGSVWRLAPPGIDAYASLVFLADADGWRFAGVGSRPVDWRKPPEESDLLFTPLDGAWLRVVLGARVVSAP